MSHEEKVYTKLKQHYHCAQAIFATYASDYGMDQETAYRTMACFAAGMYTGSVCGCVEVRRAAPGGGQGEAEGMAGTPDRPCGTDRTQTPVRPRAGGRLRLRCSYPPIPGRA